MALSNEDLAEIKRKYIEGKSSGDIGKLYGVSGSYIRKLIKDNGWKDARISAVANNTANLNEARKSVSTNGLSPARDIALLEAKSADNFGKRNAVVEEYILDQLRRGVTPTAAARSVGISHTALRQWREDPEFNLRCHEAQADFVSHVESLACGVNTPKEALALLERHTLTKENWSKAEDKHSIRIEFAYDRHSNVVDADFREVKELGAPQTEGRD